MDMVRQGDVLMVKEPGYAPSANAEKRISGIVAYGDNGSTQAHTLLGGDVFAEPNRDGEPTLFAVVGSGGGTLEHQEHASVGLEEGSYRVRRQQDLGADGQRRIVTD